ncbi:MAG TPA: hypothetical protein DEG42_05210 [Acholeplasmataceae bacterium]|nr:MAG: hypothetical protein A2Y43_00095 [Tenericutes bacterium GWA2_38_26]OHE30351.1 MAG: hypothetical protein A2084_02975 [Tenericutes bacterium GWC2_39_45]OHE32541.1 MAG: hypothetical protein A2009_05540 [Tenericutes bacterium GWD2_38_27]OHE39951.1 MAG: hypothetical protein A2102_03650 [Tenericutes bacterium GWF2_38_8]HBG33279.1 hypothetical protein [Acholeplasmataceae bacterium]
MHNETTYVDRGIIKWAPFDALVGYHSLIQELKYRLGKKDQPVLSDDQYEEMNRKLQIAVYQNLEIEVEYYKDGYTRSSLGTIRKIDWIQHVIILSTFEKISAHDIINLHLFN